MVRVSSGPTEDHEFYTLKAEGFELFARALHGVQPGIFNTNTYGTSGYKQYGADHVAYRKNGGSIEIEVGQSKAYQEFEQDGIHKAVEAFLLHWDRHWKAKNVTRFILFVGCRIKKARSTDEIIAQTARLAELGIIFEVWDASEIYNRLPAAKNVVRLYLGQPWVEHIFGPIDNPILAIVQDLASGDFGAQSAALLVGQLNRAEAGRITELRRRIRRGEEAAVRREIDQALNPILAGALAQDVHAGLLRLSASLYIRHGALEVARGQLDKADGLDGGQSQRQRALLSLHALGAEKTLEADFDIGAPDVAEVIAIARIHLGEDLKAMELLGPGLFQEKPSAEALRLAAIAQLGLGERGTAVNYARRAVSADGDSRACRQLLAITLFARSVAPAVEIVPADWPVFVDQSFVLTTDAALTDLQEARTLIAELSADAGLSDHREMLAWCFAIHACVPDSTPSAENMLARLVDEGRLIGPIVAWSLSRGFALDLELAAQVIARERSADTEDLQLLLMDIAISTQRRDRKSARTILEAGREALTVAGMASYVVYWSAVLDLDEGRTIDQAVRDEWPWLGLRVAMKIRYKARRLKEVARLAERAAMPDGDPRILFAAIQILLDASHAGTASRFAGALVEKIGTADAIALAAHVLHRANKPEEALQVLANTHLFPAATLPDDLERLRISSNASLGRLVEAARDLSRLATMTGSPVDIWTSIEWKLAVGEIAGARELYISNRQTLANPTTSHLRLAQALLRSDRQLAIDITRQMVASAPNTLVTATFEMASRLHLDDEKRRLMQRIQLLGMRGEAGVEIINDVAVVIERMEKFRQQADKNYELYRNGHVAVQMLPNLNEGGLAQQYLGNLLDAPTGADRPPLVHARYGRRYDEAIWPEERDKVSLIVDLSALLTIAGLGLMDTVERAFGSIRLAPDVINTLHHISNTLNPLQPDRLEAARHVVQLADLGALPDPSDLSPVDTFKVLWDVSQGDPDSTLNITALLEAMAPALAAEEVEAIRFRLGETAKMEAAGPSLAKDATVILDAGIAIELQLAGALDAARACFTLAAARQEIEDRRQGVLQADRETRLAISLDKLSERIAAGAQDGTYTFVPVDPKAPSDLVGRQYFQCLKAMTVPGSILWIDDRFTTSIDSPQYPVVTTVEILDALRRYGRLEEEAVMRARSRLRAAGWTFMPVNGNEIAAILLPCVQNGEVIESDALQTLRRSAAWAVQERRRLQWPNFEQAEMGIMGEIPFLFDQGHAVVGALTIIWSDKTVTVENAEIASSWILEFLDMSRRVPSVIPAGDPRSEFLIGIHIGHLFTAALQIASDELRSERKLAYLRWLWNAGIGNRLRTCPEILPHVLEAIEHLLIEDLLEDSEETRLWKVICGDFVNGLPAALRQALLSRPAMQSAFGISEHGTMTGPDGDFEAIAYLQTIIDLEPGKTTHLKTSDGKKAKFRLTRRGDQSSVTVTVGGRSHSLDDWPKKLAAGDYAVRRPALDEQASSLDRTPAELDALSAELGNLSPVQRALKVVTLASETMTGWFGELSKRLALKTPVGLSDLLPDDIAHAFMRLRLNGSRPLDEAQAQTIAAVGLNEAIQRWGGVPVVAGPAFHDAINALDDTALMSLASTSARNAPPWTKIFVAQLLWHRAARNDELRDVLADMVLGSLQAGRVEEEWDVYVACARFLTGELPQKAGWRDYSVADRLAMTWAHAGSLAENFLAARMKVKGFVEFLNQTRLASPLLLLEDLTGFSGDVANPLDSFPRRLKIHAAAPLLADIVKDAGRAEAVEASVMGVLMEREGDLTMFAARVYHGDLTQADALGSHLAQSPCPLLEPIFGQEIPLLAPRLGPLLAQWINGQEARDIRHGWIQLRSAMGHGPLPNAVASLVVDAASHVPIITTDEEVATDLIVLQSVAAIAAANGWTFVADMIDDAFDQLRQTSQSGDSVTSSLFEIAFQRACLEKEPEQRVESLADSLEKLRARTDMVEEIISVANRFADALSGSHSQPFIDLIARQFSSAT